jgi:hypothetical protein
MVTNTIDTERFILKYRKEIKVEILAMSEHLLGIVQTNLRDTRLGGTFDLVQIDEGSIFGARIGSTAEYAAYYEFGTRGQPRKPPPLAVIYDWVERKFDLIAVNVSITEGQTHAKSLGGVYRWKNMKNKQEKSDQILAIAFRIRAHIWKYGTKARYYFRNAMESMGLKYVHEQRGGEMAYQIDVAGWLEKHHQDIINRAGTK